MGGFCTLMYQQTYSKRTVVDAFRPGLSGKHTDTQLHRVKGPDITMTIVKSKWREFRWHPDYTDSRTFNDVINMYGALTWMSIYLSILT